MFKRAIAKALEISIVHVTKLTALEIAPRPGSRRLQSTQTKWYEVSYEVMVPSFMDPDAVVEKANRIAVAGSAESQAFRQVLIATDGVAQVGKIVSKIPAQKFEDESGTTPTQVGKPEDDKAWRSVVIGVVVILMAFVCLGTGAIIIKRKRQPTNQAAEGDVEAGSSLVSGAVLASTDVTGVVPSKVQESSADVAAVEPSTQNPNHPGGAEVPSSPVDRVTPSSVDITGVVSSKVQEPSKDVAAAEPSTRSGDAEPKAEEWNTDTDVTVPVATWLQSKPSACRRVVSL